MTSSGDTAQSFDRKPCVCIGMLCDEQKRSLEAKERNILRKILVSVKENREYRRWHNHELYTDLEKITGTICKRSIAFRGHTARTSGKRLTKWLLLTF